jgi:hypothetical protein
MNIHKYRKILNTHPAAGDIARLGGSCYNIDRFRQGGRARWHSEITVRHLAWPAAALPPGIALRVMAPAGLRYFCSLRWPWLLRGVPFQRDRLHRRRAVPFAVFLLIGALYAGLYSAKNLEPVFALSDSAVEPTPWLWTPCANTAATARWSCFYPAGGALDARLYDYGNALPQVRPGDILSAASVLRRADSLHGRPYTG